MTKTVQTIILVAVVAFGVGAIAVFAYQIFNRNQKPPAQPSPTPIVPTMEYWNTTYGFRFALPESWRNHDVEIENWQGATSTDSGEKIVEQGPLILIRHPLWTAENPRQDIPIIIFTLAQWDKLRQGTFHIGAAPIGPSELWRNATYVFALPARYNFANLAGYEEVEQILQSKPLSAYP